MIIKNGLVFKENGEFKQEDLFIENQRIVATKEEVSDQEVVDAKGAYVLPGFVDVHSHGAAGKDFCDADVEGLSEILKYEKAHGITSYCPTSMTLTKEELLPIFSTVKELKEDSSQARVVGINMEGPFLDRVKKGAHVESKIIHPSVDFFRECNEMTGGIIKLITLSPNEEGSEEFIKELKDEVYISIGHTTADYDCTMKAIKAGAHHITHLYNAMPAFGHREPGVIGAAFDSPEVMVELISDGYHIHPSVIRSTFQMFGPERVVLISDSMRATGMEDGTYDLGGQKVFVKNKKATLASGTLAGSSTNVFDCMKKAVEFKIPLADAIFAATRNPAKSIGIYDEVGSLTPGKRADVLLVDQELNLVKVI